MLPVSTWNSRGAFVPSSPYCHFGDRSDFSSHQKQYHRQFLLCWCHHQAVPEWEREPKLGLPSRGRLREGESSNTVAKGGSPLTWGQEEDILPTSCHHGNPLCGHSIFLSSPWATTGADEVLESPLFMSFSSSLFPFPPVYKQLTSFSVDISPTPSVGEKHGAVRT